MTLLLCVTRVTLTAQQEDSHKVDRQAEDEEKQKMAEATWTFDGHPRKFREILSRRKKKKGETSDEMMMMGGNTTGNTTGSTTGGS